MESNATLLGHIKTQDKRSNIEALCKSLGIDFEVINPGDINNPVSKLLGMPVKVSPKKTIAPVIYNPPEIIIFNGFSNDLLDKFLDKYKEAGIEPVPLKGVVTPFNFNWTVYELILEYEKEQQG